MIFNMVTGAGGAGTAVTGLKKASGEMPYSTVGSVQPRIICNSLGVHIVSLDRAVTVNSTSSATATVLDTGLVQITPTAVGGYADLQPTSDYTSPIPATVYGHWTDGYAPTLTYRQPVVS